MSITELLLRFIAGGAVVTVVSFLAKSNHPYLSGLFVLFPAVTLVGYFFISLNTPPDTVKRIALFSLYSFPTTVAFLGTFYFSQPRYSALLSLSLSVGAWILAALVLLYLNASFFHLDA